VVELNELDHRTQYQDVPIKARSIRSKHPQSQLIT
jgi:hypothetical protein